MAHQSQLIRMFAFACLTSMVVVTSASAAPQEKSKSVGFSRTLLLPGITVAGNVDESIAVAVGDLLAERLARTGRYSVISGDDLRQVLNLEAQRQLAGCMDGSCVAEIAGSLDADTVLFGRVSKLGEILIVRLTFFDARASVAEDRLVIRVRDLSELPDAIDREITKFLGEAPMEVKKEVAEEGFPWGLTGSATFASGVVVALLTTMVSVGAVYVATNPRLFQLKTSDVQAAYTTALVSAAVGAPVALALGGIGSTLLIVGLVE